MAINRLVVVLAIVVLGAVVPARAWCEANCLAPSATGQPHCPSHDPVDGAPALSASIIADCPVIESARPTIAARLNMQAVIVTTYVPAVATGRPAPLPRVRWQLPGTVFERGTPLRI